MPVVVDANLLVVLVSRDPRRAQVTSQFLAWDAAQESLHAPALMPYEIANALAGLLAAGLVADADIDQAWRAVSDVPITLHPLIDGPAAVRLAMKLGRSSAYDAAYVALASALGAELWTLDGALARNAGGAGLPARLVSTP